MAQVKDNIKRFLTVSISVIMMLSFTTLFALADYDTEDYAQDLAEYVLLEEFDSATAYIDDSHTPLAGEYLHVTPRPTLGLWSLLSLILAISGVLLGVPTLIGTLVIIQNSRTHNMTKNEERVVSKHRKLCSITIITGILAALGVIVFFTFNDVRMQMALINIWTILSVKVFAAEVVAFALWIKFAVE